MSPITKKTKFYLCAAVLFVLSSQSNAVDITKNLPFYFAIPESAWLDINSDIKMVKIPVKGYSNSPVGLRAAVYDDPYSLVSGHVKKTDKQVTNDKREYRAKITRQLHAKGLLQSGDIILSFRSDWLGTAPYPHVQMGVSHAGMIFESEGKLFNLDMPLDSEYNLNFLNSELNSNHYLETDSIHILRPRQMTDQRQSQLNDWVGELKANYKDIRNNGLLRFNSNYSEPKYGNYGASDLSFVETQGNILLGKNTSSKDLKMYCSEFTWGLYALSACPLDAVKNGGQNLKNCANPVFPPVLMLSPQEGKYKNNLSGLADGPLRILANMDIDSQDKIDLIGQMYQSIRASGLSSGHRKLAEDPRIKMLMGALEQYYTAIIYTGSEEQFASRGRSIDVKQLNDMFAPNYSPVAYLINSFLPTENPNRSFDYVATIIFE